MPGDLYTGDISIYHNIRRTLAIEPKSVFHFPLILLYRSRVARPPRICLCDLFSSKIILACAANTGLSFKSLPVISLCTVDFDSPKYFAALRTVALFSTMYLARFMVRSSIFCFTYFTSEIFFTKIYAGVSCAMNFI